MPDAGPRSAMQDPAQGPFPGPRPPAPGAPPPARGRLRDAVCKVQRALDRLCGAGGWLALPVALLLAAQWPLRSMPGGRPQLANDAAQALFALYVALALRHAWRHGAHLQTDALARRWPLHWRRAAVRALALAVMAPFAATLLALALPMAAQSLRQLEAFPESYNPGYWIIKLASALALALLALQALVEGVAGDGRAEALPPPGGGGS